MNEMGGLGYLGFQKFPSSRNRIKKMRNLHPGTGWHPTFFAMYHFPPIHKYLGALLQSGRAGTENKTADTGNGGQCLTPKAKSSHLIQITRLTNLASSMPFQG